MNARDYTPVDHLLNQFDQALRTLSGQPQTTGRPTPGAASPEAELDDVQRNHVARLMRINHTGEICAQALYQGQALTARNPAIQDSMRQSAAEENDHLQWCAQRIQTLNGRLSLLNPVWYASSFVIGACAGIAGDKWSLGFIAETEKQVENHLDEHLAQIPVEDNRTHCILRQMKEDEAEHGQKAMMHGGVALPLPIRLAMRVSAKLMTKSVYYV